MNRGKGKEKDCSVTRIKTCTVGTGWEGRSRARALMFTSIQRQSSQETGLTVSSVMVSGFSQMEAIFKATSNMTSLMDQEHGFLPIRIKSMEPMSKISSMTMKAKAK